MKSRAISLIELRAKLEINDFYADIIFKNKDVKKGFKKVIGEWIFNLERYKHIKVEKFKSLFSQLQEVIFPIKIDWCYKSNIEIIDNEGKKYTFSIDDIYDYNGLNSYIIDRRNSFLEPLIARKFHYKIMKDQTILLIETSAMQLKPNGNNSDITVTFSYDYENGLTEATLETGVCFTKIKIKYPSQNSAFNKKVQEYLFSLVSTSYYYDVLPILKWVVLVMKEYEITISITSEMKEEENVILSKVEVVNGIVEKYIKTETIGEDEVKTIKKTFAKRLEEFIAEI